VRPGHLPTLIPASVGATVCHRRAVSHKAAYMHYPQAEPVLRTHLERPAVAPLATMSGTELCQGRRMGLLGWVVQLAR
jgi:hypothetical protein